ncbi:hypothetical protein HYU45_04305 [Candidatus Daviesbacteria bacterium]|nr:hypothetical protein [Candidatus Daviesbacteria bacterium]
MPTFWQKPVFWGVLFVVLTVILIPLSFYLFKGPILSSLPLNLIGKSNPNPPSAQPSTQLTIGCPVPKEFCQKGSYITYQGKTIGLGFTLPANTSLTAVFPGTLENGSESGGIFKIKSHPVRWLHGKGKFEGLIASYSFFGEAVSSFGADKLVKPFTEGETIATTSADTFPTEAPFNEVNLIFSVTKGDRFGIPVDFSFK